MSTGSKGSKGSKGRRAKVRTPGGLSIPPSCYLLNARPRALAYRLNQIASVVGSPQFSADDQVKARAGSNLKYSTFTGYQWA